MDLYSPGPEPMGWSELILGEEAGKTLTTDRRPLSRDSKGYFSLKVTVLSSLAETESMKVRKAP